MPQRFAPGLIAALRCPRCGKALAETPQGVACQDQHVFCGGDYLDLRFEEPDEVARKTFESFGFEWNAFSTVQPEDEHYWSNYAADLPLAQLGSAMVLDAGCGKGRFARQLARHVGLLLALDGSSAVEAAARNLRDCPNVLVARGDLLRLPVAPASFDLVCCFGVLHHLGDPEKGFRSLREAVAPGGLMLLYLYSRPEQLGLRSIALRCASAIRTVTVRLPRRALRLASAPIALVLYAAFVTPGAWGDRWKLRRLQRLPLQTYRRQPLRSLWLDTFDRLSAPIEHRYVWSELESWFSESQMEVEAVREDAGFFILLRNRQQAPRVAGG